MLLPRRIYQFLIIYLLFLGVLLLIKSVLDLSDYVIPGPDDLWRTFAEVHQRYMADAVDTLSVAIIGQFLSIALAALVGILGR